MSAYIVDEHHINALVNFGRSERVTVWDKQRDLMHDFWKDYIMLGQVLVDENYKSVNYRYREHTTPYVYVFHYDTKPRTPVQILKAINCLEYQSCGHPEYYSSLAYDILQNLVHSAIYLLPGYDEAAYEIRS